MRILSGEWGGRVITLPGTRAVRPMSEKVRGALFDVVGPVEGHAVLDAYAGSGAAGLEALSRGAVMVEAVEANRMVARVIAANAKMLGADWGYVLHTMTVETWLAIPQNQPDMLSTNPDTRRYHLIVADPPYAQLDSDVLGRLGRFLVPGGVLVVSHSSKKPSPMLESLPLVQAKVYGDSALSFYQVGPNPTPSQTKL